MRNVNFGIENVVGELPRLHVKDGRVLSASVAAAFLAVISLDIITAPSSDTVKHTPLESALIENLEANGLEIESLQASPDENRLNYRAVFQGILVDCSGEFTVKQSEPVSADSLDVKTECIPSQ